MWLSAKRATSLLTNYTCILGLGAFAPDRIHRSRRYLFITTSFSLVGRCAVGKVQAVISAKEACIEYCELVPFSPEHTFLLPPWQVMPFSNRLSIAWEMGIGQIYWTKWHDWFAAIGPMERLRYIGKYPEPSDPFWTGFYPVETIATS